MDPTGTSFTPREAEVIAQLLQGRANKQIARELGISNRAVEFHLSSIYQKLGVGSRAEAIIRLKDEPIRETEGQAIPAEVRGSTVETGAPPEQNGDQPNPNRRPLMNRTAWFGIVLGAGAVMLAALLITSAGGNREDGAPPTPAATLAPEPAALIPSPPPARTTTPDAEAALIASAADHAKFVSETAPDGTSLDPGGTLTKTWTLLNDGAATWTTDYALVLTQSSHPLGQNLGEPALIRLPRSVAPGETVEIAIPLKAPDADSIFSAVYQLRNTAGEWVPGDGGLIWFSVVVGNPAFGNSQTGGISVELESFQMDAGYTSATFCAQYPDAQDWNPYPVTLEAGGEGTGIDSYQLLGAKDPGTGTSSKRCFILGFPVGADQAGSGPITITIQSFAVDASTNLEANCARAKQQLAATHPGLDFTCGSPGSFYGSIQPAAGMTMEQAAGLVMEALEQRIYGPWVFTR